MKRLFACITLPMLFLAGCSNAAPEAAHKSAGVTGGLRQELRIDGHEHELLPIRAIAVNDDGTIAVLHYQESAFRVFASDGQAIGNFGREGGGPGEFRFVTSFGWRADTLWVYDEGHRRLTLMTPELKPGRIVGNLPQRIFGISPDGWLLTQRAPFDWPQAIQRMQAADSSWIAILELPAIDVDKVWARTPLGSLTLPLANLPFAAFAVDGSRVAGAMASLEGADAGTFSLTVVDPAGDTIFGRRYPFEQERITRAAADSFMDAFVAIGEGPGAPPPAKTWAKIIRSSTRIPPVWPPLLGLVVGSDGSIWVELRKLQGASRYYVVAADGDPVGTVVLPKRARLGAATKDRVWLIEMDEFEVESLVRYSIGWRAPRAD